MGRNPSQGPSPSPDSTWTRFWAWPWVSVWFWPWLWSSPWVSVRFWSWFWPPHLSLYIRSRAWAKTKTASATYWVCVLISTSDLGIDSLLSQILQQVWNFRVRSSFSFQLIRGVVLSGYVSASQWKGRMFEAHHVPCLLLEGEATLPSPEN